MSRTIRDPLAHMQWDTPEFGNRVKWGLEPISRKSHEGHFDLWWGQNAKRYSKKRWARVQRSRDQATLREELGMMEDGRLPC